MANRPAPDRQLDEQLVADAVELAPDLRSVLDYAADARGLEGAVRAEWLAGVASVLAQSVMQDHIARRAAVEHEIAVIREDGATIQAAHKRLAARLGISYQALEKRLAIQSPIASRPGLLTAHDLRTQVMRDLDT